LVSVAEAREDLYMAKQGRVNEVSSPKVLRCGCRVIGSPYGERRLKNCAEHKKATPPMGRAPKKEPKLMPMLHGTIYCTDCDDEFYAKIHAKGRQHKLSGMGHYSTYNVDAAPQDVATTLAEYTDKYTKWLKTKRAFTQSKGVSQQERKFLKATGNEQARLLVLRGGGKHNDYVVWSTTVIKDGKKSTKSMTAEGVFNFSIRRVIKQTKNRDWDLYEKEIRGVSLLEDLASKAVEKFLTALSKRTIRNGWSYLSSCVESAIQDYRKERAEMRLAVVPKDVFDYIETLGIDIADPSTVSDYYEGSKLRPDAVRDLHTLQTLFVERGIDVPPSHLRAVFNALVGKNRGLQGNATTKRYIRNVIKKLRDSEDGAMQAIYTTLTGSELPRPKFKAEEKLTQGVEALEVEFPVTRWVLVDGERVTI